MAYLGHLTHTFHNQLRPPECDIAIFSGDCTNPKDLLINERECRDFIKWFGNLKIPTKIAIAGNHDVSIERNRITPGDFSLHGIIYLENNYTTVDGFRIWGSPITPTFGNGWAFNKSRETINRVWDIIDDNTDIIVTHGPPKGILDLSYNIDGELEYCGCGALMKRVLKIKPKAVLFGHIHDSDYCYNAGTMKLSGIDTIFSNGSIVHDNKFQYGAMHNGNIINLER